jgi:hypothetical protein
MLAGQYRFRPDQLFWLDGQVNIRKGLAAAAKQSRSNINRGAILRELVDKAMEEDQHGDYSPPGREAARRDG